MDSSEPSISAWAIWRRAAPVVVAAALVVAVTAGLALRQDRLHREELRRREARHVLGLERSFLVQTFRGLRSDLVHLASQPLLVPLAAGDESARAPLEGVFERFARSKPVYQQVRLLDVSGREVLRINRSGDDVELVPAARLQSKSDRYYFREALAIGPGEVFVSPLDLNVERGEIERPPRPVVRLASQVRDAAGEVRGVVILNAEGARLLDGLREIARGSAGEVALVNLEGEYLQAANPAREWGWLLGHEASFRSDHPDAWEHIRAAQRFEGVVDGVLFTSRREPLDPAAESSASDVFFVSRVALDEGPGALGGALAGLLAVGLGAAILAGAYTWSRSTLTRALHERRIEESEARLRTLSRRLLDAQEEERRSLSRVLHDELGQTLTAIALDLKLASRRITDEETARSLTRAVEQTEELLKGLHDLATRVRPSVLDDLGFESALESLVEDSAERTGLAVDLSLPAPMSDLSRVVAENVYRIVQEGLANVAQHAGTDAARVALRSHEGELEIVIEDRGRGFDPALLETSSRLGLLGMRERVELLDGTFSLTSAPGAGTRIDARLPLAEEPAATRHDGAAKGDER